MINNLDPDLKFIFENRSKSLNFLDVNIRLVENNPVFDIHYKPTNSFNYLTYTSCHLPHTKNNISLSLEKCFVSILTNNREIQLKEVKEHLLDRKHPQHTTIKVLQKYFSENFKLKITIALHLSEPTIRTTR